MKKNVGWIVMALCAALACVALTGCMNSGKPASPTAQPGERPEASAAAGTDAIGMTNPATAAPAFDWAQKGAEVEAKIGLLSEIQSARVVVVGNTALVGVEFTGEYQGEMTQRIRDMVAGEVQTADPNVQTVAVTAEQEDVEKIKALVDRMAAGTPASELEGEVDSIVRNVTTIQ